MSIWEQLFKFLFGGGKKQPPASTQPAPAQPAPARPAPAPARPSAPPPRPQPTQSAPPAPARQPDPIIAPPLEAPPAPAQSPDPVAAGPLETPPAGVGAIDLGPGLQVGAIPAAQLSLASLVARDRTPLSAADVAAAAGRLGVEEAAIRAVVQIESAGAGFGPDGRPLILFDPGVFSALTGARFDASNPAVSMSRIRSGALGANQAERWAKLEEAYGLDAEAALKATSWGLFQIAGSSHRDAGAADVFGFVQDQAHSEQRQLAGFEAVIRSKGLADELRNQDWDGFARVYNGENGVARYAQTLGEAYVRAKREAGGGASASFLDSLVARDTTPLTDAQIRASAERLGCEVAAVRAVLKVESRGAGFGPDGRPIILYEPHIFSRLTGRKYDASHPTISYRNWRERPYPRTQADRYAQLAQAYALEPEAALGSASWGLFQILGSNHVACGFETASAFVADIAISHERQLLAFEGFVRTNRLVDDLQNRDWAGFARVYNGPGQVETYGRLLSEAYAEAKAAEGPGV